MIYNNNCANYDLILKADRDFHGIWHFSFFCNLVKMFTGKTAKYL